MGEFNVNKSDGSLKQTAGMPSEYPATQVMLSDGVTSVEDAVDEVVKRADAYTLGTFVNISAYTSSNPYVAPSDGYVRLYLAMNATGRAFINGQMLMGTERAMSYTSFVVFVKKGMTAYMDTIVNATLTFVGILNN